MRLVRRPRTANHRPSSSGHFDNFGHIVLCAARCGMRTGPIVMGDRTAARLSSPGRGDLRWRGSNGATAPMPRRAEPSKCELSRSRTLSCSPLVETWATDGLRLAAQSNSFRPCPLAGQRQVPVTTREKPGRFAPKPRSPHLGVSPPPLPRPGTYSCPRSFADSCGNTTPREWQRRRRTTARTKAAPYESAPASFAAGRPLTTRSGLTQL